MRKWIKYSLIGILSCFADHSFGQTFNRNYIGEWTETEWQFVFRKNGTYSRMSSGYYGNTLVSGKYKIKKDTLYIESCDGMTHGTISSKYYLHNDSIMIDPTRFYILQRIPTYKSNKKIAICMNGVTSWQPDSIYLKHPGILPRLDESSSRERYWNNYEKYILGDTIKAKMVESIKGVEPDKNEIISHHTYGHRSGSPAVYVMTDSSGDYFVVVDCEFDNNIEIGDKVRVSPSNCYFQNIKVAFNLNYYIKFMIYGVVRKVGN